MSENGSRGNQWWEFYIIRYSMGTIVGAVIVYKLFNNNPELRDLLLLPRDNKLEYFHFILLAFYGLTYSYIASAPFLVLHASRFAFSYSDEDRLFKPQWYAYTLIIISLLLGLAFMFPNLIDMFRAIIVLLFLAILVPQWILIFYSVKKIDDNFKFYTDLSQKRENSKTDFRESYKHLREHGNSFGILFFEIVLGVILIAIGSEKLAYFLGFMFVWILPAIYVWFVGTGLENRFARK
ncbi:MAG: hypothetical protein ACYC6Q_07555 [Syntrophales bacterium]